MPDWDELRKIAESEAADVADGLRSARDRLDAHLAKKETEMAATPKERMDMLLDDIEEQNAATDALLAEVDPDASVSVSASDDAPRASPNSDGSQTEVVADAIERVADAETTDETASVDQAETPAATDSGAAPATRPAPRPVSQLHVEYEQRKADADELLDELRQELGLDGDESPDLS